MYFSHVCEGNDVDSQDDDNGERDSDPENKEGASSSKIDARSILKKDLESPDEDLDANEPSEIEEKEPQPPVQKRVASSRHQGPKFAKLTVCNYCSMVLHNALLICP